MELEKAITLNKQILPQSSTNLKSRVNKLHLPKTKPLLPLFEIISNSIHAIQDVKAGFNLGFKGKIYIKLIRNGDEEALKKVSDIEIYPINSIIVKDNGIGLDDENFKSFEEFDSERKAKIGGKGIGRLVCLKAFRKIIIESVYSDNGVYKIRKFEYKKSKDGFDRYENSLTNISNSGTSARLSIYEDDYIKYVPLKLIDIARQIITHFQLYFIQGIEPEIIIKNQYNSQINLRDLFNNEFENEIINTSFNIGENAFSVFISKSYKGKSHKIHYCAHERSVKEEGLSKYIVDLKYTIKTEINPEGFFYEVFVIGNYLNKNVNEERTSFNFTLEEENEENELEEITLSTIRKTAILAIESLLSDSLAEIRKKKLEEYYPIIKREFPNYNSVIQYNKDKVERLPIGLSKNELDQRLYVIESEWKIKVKNEGLILLDKKKDITNLEEYASLYDKYLTEFNEIGQSDLARYVIHRRSVIDLLDKLIELNQADKFANEEIVHSLFFPIRETGNSISSDKQNLWLLDERLTFNSLLASDKLFKHVEALNSSSSDRMDIIVKKEEVYENATLFSENKYPFESFTIVEFKRPERNDYKHGDREKDPIKQVRSYIDEIINNKEKYKGKSLEATKNTPFYCYIIADVTESLLSILDYEDFDKTPDGMGYFKFYDTKNSRSYIEVLPFRKIIKDAKQRNKILFDKLNIC